jgi:hypothetical protein
VKAQVPSCLGNNIVVLRAEGVLLRPDLAIIEIDAPQQVYAGAMVNVVAVVTELNGDLGAGTILYLVEEGKILDQVGGGVGANGVSSFVFSTVFDTLGVHKLSVIIAQTAPSDYDYSNNAKEFSVEVVQQPAYYDAYYNHYQNEYSQEYFWPWWQSGTNYQKVNQENLAEYLYIPATLSFPLENVSIQTFADGSTVDSFEFQGLEADYSSPPPDYYAQAHRQLAEGFDLYIQTLGYPWFQYSYVQLLRYVVDDVYYSESHDLYWGTNGVSSYTKKYGSFLNGQQTVGTRIVIKSGSAAVGGTVTIPLNQYSWDYPYIYEDPETGAYDRSYSRGTNTYGSSSGSVIP